MSDWDRDYQKQKSALAGNPLLEDDDGDVQMAPPVRQQIEDAEPETQLQQLIRHWMNERHSPDILPAQERLLGSLLDHLRRQSDTVQLLRSDPSTSEEEHIRIMLVQTEVERVKFIVRSYVCTRLFKIEKYARFIAAEPDIQSRITVAERDHAIRHAKLTEKHFHVSVLQSLPQSQSYLNDDNLLLPSMVTQPDKARPVFAHALRDSSISLPNIEKETTLQKGQIVLAPFYSLEEGLHRGDVELV